MNETTANGSWRIGLWLSGAVMLIAMYSTSMDQDVEFWKSWVWQLQLGGYQALASMWPPANYPPLIQHWFKILAWILSLVGATPDNDMLVKAWTLLPVFLSQLALVELVARTLLCRGAQPMDYAIFWLTVFNPAIMIAGPVWGQVDLLPFLPLYAAMATALNRRQAVWTMPLLALALLIKFQAIVFVPVVAGLALKHWRRHLTGAVLAVMLVLLAFAPFIAAGGVPAAMERAYWGNIGAFPYFSLNAANFWYLYAGGSHIQTPPTLLNGDWAGSALAPLISPSKIGIVVFAGVSLWALLRCLRRPDMAEATGMAVFAALGFFAFSSAMHERYLFLAVPFCAVWVARQPRYALWYPLLTAIVYLNTNFVLNLASPAAWKMLSVGVIVAFTGLALHQCSRHFTAGVGKLAVWAGSAPKLPYGALFLAWLIVVGVEMAHSMPRPSESRIGDAESLPLSRLAPENQYQEWGELHLDSNLQGGPLCIADRCFDQGIATHARSVLAYRVPEDACRFTALAGMDREGGGDAQFSLKLDDVLLWKSQSMTVGTPAAAISVDIEGGRRLLLEVDSLGDNRGDHADWAEARFEGCAGGVARE